MCYAGARLLAPYNFLAPSSTYGSIVLLKLRTHKERVLFYRRKKKDPFLSRKQKYCFISVGYNFSARCVLSEIDLLTLKIYKEVFQPQRAFCQEHFLRSLMKAITSKRDFHQTHSPEVNILALYVEPYMIWRLI